MKKRWEKYESEQKQGFLYKLVRLLGEWQVISRGSTQENDQARRLLATGKALR